MVLRKHLYRGFSEGRGHTQHHHQHHHKQLSDSLEGSVGRKKSQVLQGIAFIDASSPTDRLILTGLIPCCRRLGYLGESPRSSGAFVPPFASLYILTRRFHPLTFCLREGFKWCFRYKIRMMDYLLSFVFPVAAKSHACERGIVILRYRALDE